MSQAKTLRIAFFTPLAPVPSGTADYASELLPYLAQRAHVEIFVDPAHQRETHSAAGVAVHPYQDFEKLGGPQRYDALLYAIANNPFHYYAYRMARRYPGVVLLHDYNLHHLLVHVTSVSNNWEEYFRLVEEEGGAQALERARLVKQAITGPDYDNLNLNRHLLRAARGALVHSDYVKGLIENTVPGLPVRMIRHGVQRVELSPEEVAQVRRRLNLPAKELIIGSFGFIKPYKRITSCLRALGEARPDLPPFTYLLVGEEHPYYPVREEIKRLGLQGNVRITGRVDLSEFWDYILATDICLTLRYPTAGETSGSLLREMAAGKTLVVSNVGAFAEWPDNCVAKVDADAFEVPQLVGYLKMFAAYPIVRQLMGHKAQAFVRSYCSWERVAEDYVDCLAESAEVPQPQAPVPAFEKTTLPLNPPALEEFIVNFWTHRPDAQAYARAHLERIAESLAWIPRGRPAERLLEMGCYLQMTPVLAKYYGYGEIRGAYGGDVISFLMETLFDSAESHAASKDGLAGIEVREIVHADNSERYCFTINHFDAERDPFPYPANSFRTVLCCELIEHLRYDPMHMLFEINRILLPGGYLLLTTPNTASWRSLQALLRGGHPNFFPSFLRRADSGGERHAREYTPPEIKRLLTYAGLEPVRLETRDFYGRIAIDATVRQAALATGYKKDWGGDTIIALARKVSPPSERYPDDFYA